MTSNAVFLDFATLGSDGPDPAPLLEVLPALELFSATPPELVAERIARAEFVLANKARLDEAAIAGARALRYIGLTATGTDNVDLAAARRAGVTVANIRAYCTRSVVEHVFAVLLSLAHSIGPYHRAVRSGEWQRAPNFCLLDFPIRELSAMTLGIVGHGELGRAVAEAAGRFGMSVIVAARRGGRIGDGRVAFAEMLARADVVSLHCPLTENTRNMIGLAELEHMKPDAILINTARGGLVDSAALVRALREGVIAGAAIDVLPEEPPVGGNPLLDYAGDNLILTPHIAWATLEARQNALVELARNVRAFLDGEDRNRVDQEA